MVVSRRIGSVATEAIESGEQQINGPKTMPGSMMLVGHMTKGGRIITIQSIDIEKQNSPTREWLDRLIKAGNSSSERLVGVRLTDHQGVCLNFPVNIEDFDVEALIQRIESSPKLKTMRP